MCGILMHFKRTAAKVYNVWLRKYTTSVLWFSCFLMWLDVPASKTQLLYTCACAVNFHWLIHSTCLIDKLAVSGQLQHAANLLKCHHFTQAHSSIGPRFSLSWGHICVYALSIYEAVLQDIPFYPSPEPHAHPWHALLCIHISGQPSNWSNAIVFQEKETPVLFCDHVLINKNYVP